MNPIREEELMAELREEDEAREDERRREEREREWEARTDV